MRRVLIATAMTAALAAAQSEPTIDLSGFSVRTVASGLNNPTTMAFIGTNDFLVLEKNSGKVLRFRDGRMDQDPVLDLSVNNASERGLLGIAVNPRFPADSGIYLYWTCRSSQAGTIANGPAEEVCDTSRMTGIDDTSDILTVPLRGNRVDRFTWDGEKLAFDKNIIMLRSFQADGAATPPAQNDEAQPARGNHDGGVITFGPDGKLYIFFGDQGRRGRLQNLAGGPTPPAADDQFGGPDPDDNHFTGVILRLNPDGTVPEDNPFIGAASAMTGPVAENVRKIFAYGVRNSFGMTFDPFSGNMWLAEHGDDTFDEINMIRPGMNGGWVQVAGPLTRISEFSSIENTFFAAPEPFPSLQQWRYPPSRIATSPTEARARMVMLDGAVYADPQFSWRWATFPGTLGFAPRSFGRSLAGALLVNIVGTPTATVGYLLRFPMHTNRRVFEFDSAALADRVADNLAKYDLTESEPLIIGSGFGIATDMKISPRDTLYVVSLSQGAIYEITNTAPRQPEDADPDIDGLGPPLTGTFNPPAGTPSSNPPGGTIEIRLNSGRELLCYDAVLRNTTTSSPLALRQETDGNDVVALEIPISAQGQGSGCVNAGAGLVRSIRANTAQFYVGVNGQDRRSAPAIAQLQ